MRAVVVGAGPAGYYATDKLLAAGFEVDLLDALPTLFGVGAFGVAPDHPNMQVDPAEVDVEVPEDAEPTARRNVGDPAGLRAAPAGSRGGGSRRSSCARRSRSSATATATTGR